MMRRLPATSMTTIRNEAVATPLTIADRTSR
jgi:hypothetical protein